MQINVTAEDIETGQPYDYPVCPVARALTRATRHYVSVWADRWYDDGPIDGPGSVYGDYSGTGRPLPNIALVFIAGFDHRGTPGFEDVQLLPFSFEIDWPE